MISEDRTEAPTTGDERTTLVAMLDRHRDTFAWKCSGLAREQLTRCAVPPSQLSLFGLVRHLIAVERSWFQRVLRGSDEPAYELWEPGGEFYLQTVSDDDVEETFAWWRRECERSRAAVRELPSLDAVVEYRDRRFSVRFILVHLIEEYARHNGHADLLRERLDGATGE